jgi:hypothetical protein
MKLALLVVAVVMGTVRIAGADQCQVVTKKQANDAVGVLSTGTDDYLSYCEPCKDPRPTAASIKTVRVDEVRSSGETKYKRAVEAKPVKGGYTVYVNDVAVDVAYVYYHQRRGQDDVGPYTVYSNIAKLVGCSTTGVTENITVHDKDESAAKAKQDADAEKLKRQRLEAPSKVSVKPLGCTCDRNAVITVTCRIASSAEVPVDVMISATAETTRMGLVKSAASSGKRELTGLGAGQTGDLSVPTAFGYHKKCGGCNKPTCSIANVFAK